MTLVVTEHERECELCGRRIGIAVTQAPAGMPDWVHARDPQTWIGWCRDRGSSTLELIVLCNQQCLESWYEHTPAVLAGSAPFPSPGGVS